MVQATNWHELMHCLEVLNLIDLGELVLISCNERKETRQSHIRADYPFTNPLLGKYLTIQKAGEKPALEWKAVS